MTLETKTLSGTVTGDITGARNAMTEAELYGLERLFSKYGHGPVLDGIASIMEPHQAEDESDGRKIRRNFATSLRFLASILPDVRY